MTPRRTRSADEADPGSNPHLYHFCISHFNEKVRWALDRKRWPHRRTALTPGFHLPRVRWMTGQEKTPVLELEGRFLYDSTHIIAELERLRPDPPLYPADPEERAKALAIEDHFDEEVAPDVRRLFWETYLPHPGLCARMATDGSRSVQRLLWRCMRPFMFPIFSRKLGLDRASLEQAHARLPGHFDHLESLIGPSGYLVGDAFSVADLTAASIMTAILRPPEFPYPLPEPWPPELIRLRDSFAHRRGFQWVMDIYANQRDPSAEIVGPLGAIEGSHPSQR